MKEKLTKEESDQQQQLRQMELIQQDVARIPPAAVSELVGTDIRKFAGATQYMFSQYMYSYNNIYIVLI